MIQSNTSTLISKYVRKNLYIFFLSSGGYSFTINYLEDKMRHGMWVHILLSNLASFLTTRVLILADILRYYPEIFEFKVFVRSNN